MALFQGTQAIPPGDNTIKNGDKPVTVTLVGGTVTFAAVTKDGSTSMTEITTPVLPIAAGFALWGPNSYWDVSTTAEYTSPVTVCLDYNSSLSDEAPQLIHWYRNEWADITLYTTDTGACGELMDLSPYAVGFGFPFNMMLSSVRVCVWIVCMWIVCM